MVFLPISREKGFKGLLPEPLIPDSLLHSWSIQMIGKYRPRITGQEVCCAEVFFLISNQIISQAYYILYFFFDIYTISCINSAKGQ
jgi:hypothetical protein